MRSVKSRLSGERSWLALGGFGASEILLSTLSRLSPSGATNAVSVLAESSIVSSLLATVSLMEAELALLATVAGMLFFGYGVYEFLPGVFPEQFDVLTRRGGYRLIATVFVIGGAEVIARLIADDPLPGQMTITMFLLGVTPLVISVGYVAAVVYRDAAEIEEAARAVSERLHIAGPGKGHEAIEAESTRKRFSHIVSVAVMLAIPLPFLAAAVVAASQLYPVPELLAIGWGFLAIANVRPSRETTDHPIDPERVDLEGSAFDLVVNAVRSQKGIPVVLITLLGFGGATALVGVLNSNTPRFTREGLSAVTDAPLFAWSVVGMVVVLLSTGLFAVWFWTRVIKRVPRYLRAWNVTHAETSPLSDESLPETVTRPVGMLVPVFVALLPATGFAQLLRFDFFFGARQLLVGVYAVVWPVSVGLLAYCVYRTHNAEPQPPLSDGRALPVALCAEYSVFLSFSLIVNFVGEASNMQYPPKVDGTGVLLLILLVAIHQYAYPDVAARAKNADGWRAHQGQLFMFAGGAVSAVGALFNVVPGYGLLLGILAALFMGAPVWEIGRTKL